MTDKPTDLPRWIPTSGPPSCLWTPQTARCPWEAGCSWRWRRWIPRVLAVDRPTCQRWWWSHSGRGNGGTSGHRPTPSSSLPTARGRTQLWAGRARVGVIDKVCIICLIEQSICLIRWWVKSLSYLFKHIFVLSTGKIALFTINRVSDSSRDNFQHC